MLLENQKQILWRFTKEDVWITLINEVTNSIMLLYLLEKKTVIA